MSKIYINYLRFLEYFFMLIGKDPMKLKLKRYRYYGSKIGKNVRAFSPVSSSESYLISIGDDTTISSGVKFITHDNSISKSSQGTDLVGPITVGKKCFIGMNSIILPGVEIADNTIIAAGSVVTKSVFNVGQIIAGNPAKSIGNVENFTQKNIEKIFNFKNLSKEEKKKLIFENENMWIKK
ncbi:acyltransferase [Streptococcus uberis]|uniref:acyltransferase n=1 Tax=Streptococcus uberis TaxID=1349 RepID=UPI0006228739|nr:acyltransferase [Streptococcus uberis]KKF55801.1 CapG [Streptococcus uberis 6780]MCK1249543.1 acyltransferase [Streptococcus uberis]MCR4257297.1 acyltransferase [Streptococcus uberis]MEE3738684.1 acyltransferase [Streptococcus uberis]